ncbi:venom carboxylesterase-6 [Folsomia candida]|nr:venom carboxylesterase-6 [Folsomia candida]
MRIMGEKKVFVAIFGLAIAYYYTITTSQSFGGPTVVTKYGGLKGIKSVSRGGRDYFEFLAIPYAKPPTGELRFESPQRPEKWKGVRDAGSYGAQCIQLELLLGIIMGDEDCLFLNVFTPKIKEDDDQKLFPVMIYIHGGLYLNGGSDLWRPHYFMDNDVVLVTINYRLAAMGFLSTGDGVVRGNMALKDQSMALRFVKENIESFGGDPDKITVFGESAGGVSSHFHMLSPMSKGLFHRAISESGTGTHFWVINNQPGPQAQRLGAQVGCPTNDTRAMVDCLKKLDASDIVGVHMEVLDPLRDHVTIFKPTIEVIDDDQAFLTKHPKEIIKSGNFSRLPWIAGVNSEEGLITSAAIMANQTLKNLAQNDWSDFVSKLLLFQKNDEIAQKIRDFYFKDTKDVTTFDNIHKYTNMIGDRGFFTDMHHCIRLHAKWNPTYVYFYSYPGEWTVANLFMEVRGTLPRLMEVGWAVISSWVTRSLLGRSLPNYGASHGDELALLFQMPWISDIPPESRDYKMSLDLVKLWVDFANQEESLTFRNVPWNPIKVSSGGKMKINYLNIDKTPKITEEPFTERVKFWDKLNLTYT